MASRDRMEMFLRSFASMVNCKMSASAFGLFWVFALWGVISGNPRAASDSMSICLGFSSTSNESTLSMESMVVSSGLPFPASMF